MSEEKKASEVLIETRRLIEDEESWRTGSLIDLDGPAPRYCLMGALGKAKGFDDRLLTAESKTVYDAASNSDGSGVILAEAIYWWMLNEYPYDADSEEARYYIENPNEMYVFNDEVAGGHADILTVLDKAIELALNREKVQAQV